MKTIRFVTTIALLMTVYTLTAFAQDEEQYRGMFRDKATSKSDAMSGIKINIELLRDKHRQFVPLDTVFRAGDKVKLHFEINFPAHVTIYNEDTTGEVTRLFPDKGESNTVRALSECIIPNKNREWFNFDNVAGTEILTFIFTPTSTIAPPPRHKSPAEQPTANQRARQVAVAKEQAPAVPTMPKRVAVARSDDEDEDEDSRGMQRVQVGNDHYIFGKTRQAARQMQFVLNLRHK